MDTMQTIRSRLSEVSATELSQKTGIAFSQIYRIRNGIVAAPSVQTVEALLAGMGLSLEISRKRRNRSAKNPVGRGKQ